MTTQKNINPTIDYIIDATNVCNWHVANKGVRSNSSRNNEHNANVSLDTLLKLVNVLIKHNRTFQCIFDANTSYNLPEEELKIYNYLLSDYKEKFYQVTGGIKADAFVLSFASNYSSKVISNDNFNDYQSSYPWVKRDAKPQRLFKGGIPMVAGMKHLILPDLAINEAINESTENLFNQLRSKLGSTRRQDGKIKNFDIQKGVGFITTREEEEIYFNRSHIKILEETPVDFVLNSTNDGKTYAADIQFKISTKPPKIWTGESICSGVIDWFNEEKGFGAIKETVDEKKPKGKKKTKTKKEIDDETVFFFKSGFDNEEIKPKPGVEVVYERRRNKKGPYAANIKLGRPEDFLLKKDLFVEDQKLIDGLQQDLQKQSKLVEEIEKQSESFKALLILNKDTIYRGVIDKYKDAKGIIRIVETDIRVNFEKAVVINANKGVRTRDKVKLQVQVSKDGSLKASKVQIVVNKSNSESPAVEAEKAPQKPNAQKQRKQVAPEKEKVEATKSNSAKQNNSRSNNSKNNSNTNTKNNSNSRNQRKTDSEKPKVVEPVAIKKEEKTSRPVNKPKPKTKPKGKVVVTSNQTLVDPLAKEVKSAKTANEQNDKKQPNKRVVEKPKNRRANEKKPMPAKAMEVEKVAPVEVVEKTAPVEVVEKENPTEKKGKPKRSFKKRAEEEAAKPRTKFKPKNERSGDKQKLVIWAKDEEEKDFLLIYRLKAKEQKVDLWIIDEQNIKPAFLKKMLKDDQKIDVRTLPKQREQEVLPFNPNKILPENWSTNQENFIEKIVTTWSDEVNKDQLYDTMKAEVATIYKKVKTLKVYNIQLWDKAISAGDKVIQHGQKGNISKEQSADLRKDINQCYERLRQLPKRKS